MTASSARQGTEGRQDDRPVGIEVLAEGNGTSHRVAAVDRALRILESFTAAKPELGLIEVAKRAKLHKATAHRLLRTLAARGFVTKHPETGRYRLGYRLVPLAEIAKEQDGLTAAAKPIMRQVRDILNETVFLSVRSGDYRYDLDQVEGQRDVRRVLRIGERKELYAGAASKVLLSDLSDEEIAEYLSHTPLTAFSPTTVTDADQLMSEIRAIRSAGYAESWDERNSGGAGASAGIVGPSGEILASIGVSMPVPRYTPEVRQQSIRAILEGANAISHLLGARNSPRNSSQEQ